MVAKKFDAAAEAAEIEDFFAAQEARYEALKARATAPAWVAQPGDRLFGTVVGFAEGTPKDQKLKAYPIVLIEKPDGTVVSVHAFHGLLQQGFQDINVKKGMRVGITYIDAFLTNEAKKKDEKDLLPTDTYHLYHVADLDNLDNNDSEVGFTIR